MTEHDIFAAAINLTGDARAAFLNEACGQNTKLREQVSALLNAHEETGGLLPRQLDRKVEAQRMEATLPVGIQTAPGTIIAGRYKLLEVIGEGGMGSVWVAEQTQPVKRKVALKLIKAGMDSKSVLARFEAERQALAVMDHPNIAKVFDGGLTEQGRPYFVMEYVKGIPITEYCDSQKLNISERLQLFAQVCQAVQHAHQKGIIHRDLKPSNIMVAPYDDTPIPKVIDFGLAKAMHQSLTENTLHTGHDMVMGTPLYMSPEQAQLNNIDIDTRSDVYSLGVLLYELLTGSTPLEKKRFKQAAWDEMRRMIREEDPLLPSQRLSSCETLPSVAAGRHTEPARLTRLVRGELDWIVMKALEKDRTRRYETANGFAADVLRYLSGEPVMAAPPSTMYRIQKFAGRNKGKVIASGLVLMTLLTGVAGTSWQWYRAENSLAAEAIQRKKAEDNERAAETARAEAVLQQSKAQEQEAEAKKQAAAAKLQEAEAKKQAEIAAAVAKFQTDMLASVNPSKLPLDPVTKEPMKDAVTVVQVLEAAVKVLDEGNLKDQPLVEASVRNTIGTSLSALGRYSDAEPNLRKSLALRRACLPVGDLEIVKSLNSLAWLLKAQNKLDEAETLLRDSLKIHCASLPAMHPKIADSKNNLAWLLIAQSKFTEAELLLRESIEISRATRPVGDSSIAASLNNLGGLLESQNKFSEAESLHREALNIRRANLPAGHLDITDGLNYLADLLQSQNKLAEAEPLLREALEIRRAALPERHPNIAASLNALAVLFNMQNMLAEAEPLMREALEINRAAHSAGHPEIATSMNNLGTLLLSQNKLEDAEPLIREALEITRAAYPAGHQNIARGLNNVALILRSQNKLAEAEPLLREALEIDRTTFVAGHPEISNSLNNLAEILRGQNKLAEAEPLYREGLAIVRETLPAGHPKIATSLNNLAAVLQAQNKLAEAEPLYRETLEIRRVAFPESHPLIIISIKNLTGQLYAQNKLAEAEPLLREVLAINRKYLPAEHSDIADSLNSLAVNCWNQGKLDKSVPLFEEVLKARVAALGRTHVDTIESIANLGVNYHDAGRLSEAIPLLEEAYKASNRGPRRAFVGQKLLDAYAKMADLDNPKSIALVTTQINEMLADDRAALPSDSPQLAGKLVAAGMTLLTIKAWDDAEPLIREALAIREKVEPDAWTTFNTKSMLGGAMLGKKRFAESAPLLLAGYQGLKQLEKTIPSQGMIRVPEALERLVQLYTDWHAVEPEQGYDAKAADWQTQLINFKAVNAEPLPTTSNGK